MTGDRDETRCLVTAAADGDPVAVDSLLERHLPGLHAFVRLRVGPLVRAHENPSDLVQSVCRELLEDLGGFRYDGEAAFKQWLYKRALHKIIDRDRHYRAEKRGGGRLPVSPAIAGEQSGDDAEHVLDCYRTFCTPSQVAIGREALREVEEAFALLPDDYREVILQARILGMSHEQIADQAGRSPAAVRTRLCRALARLATLLDDRDAHR